MAKIKIRGIEFDDVNMEQALQLCRGWLLEPERSTPAVIHTPSAEVGQICVRDSQTRELFNSADLIVADGSGIILASKILGTPLKKGKVAGCELSEHIIEMCAELGLGVFLLGGKPGVAQLAAEKLTGKYPRLVISGVMDGFFKEDGPVIAEINRSGAAFLFVCMGVPRQERWLNANRGELKVKLAGGFGGSVDIFAGTVKRAPKLFLKFGIEWLYRLILEPTRIGRMMKLPKFIFGTVWVRMTGRSET